MTRLLTSLALAAGFLLTGCSATGPANHGAQPAEAVVALPAFNQLVLAQVARYPADGTHTYWWPRKGESAYDGSTKDVYIGGVKVMSGEAGRRTFCCGLTLEVFLDAFAEHQKQNAAVGGPTTAAEWAEFKRLWFVSEANGPGPTDAMVRFGLGRGITAAEARDGDFVQLWRTNGSGHSVIFRDWVRDDAGTIIGFRYWSTQPSTNGIGETVEYFDTPANRTAERQKNLVVESFTYYTRFDPVPAASAGSH